MILLEQQHSFYQLLYHEYELVKSFDLNKIGAQHKTLFIHVCSVFVYMYAQRHRQHFLSQAGGGEGSQVKSALSSEDKALCSSTQRNHTSDISTSS